MVNIITISATIDITISILSHHSLSGNEPIFVVHGNIVHGKILEGIYMKSLVEL